MKWHVKQRFSRQGALWRWLPAVLLVTATVAYLSVDWIVAESPSALADATYVGRAACIDCHQAEHSEFEGSHHDRAMELATEQAVLGNFDDVEFERLGVVTRFFRRGDEYWVNTEGPDGAYHDYQIKYTFGVDPLQQYMVEFPDGRVQVLRVSWDTLKKQWFYVPPPDATDVRLAPDDPTHWTGIAQNWNSTCASCHSTNLQKNYDLDTNTYQTTFSEIDVSCEACHGPGSLHVKLAKAHSPFWDRRHGNGLAKLKSLDPTAQLESCAPCHSRRTEVHPNFRPGRPLSNYYDVSLLSPGLYHADGQILDEVYVYGSFLQSRMHREGVRCTDCHNPHSLKLKFEGNALCAQCHVPAKYDTPAHHHHKPGTLGASCVECHMPETTYMVVDPRRDHSIRVPRPDLSVAIGTPNACNNCHTMPYESAQWAADKIVEWYGEKRPDDPNWAKAIAGGREADPAALTEIIDSLNRPNTPGIVKATLCELLSRYRSPEARTALESALTSSDAMIRRAAISNVQVESLQKLLGVAVPVLSDPIRTVRIAAAVRLLNLPPSTFEGEAKLKLEAAIDEFKTQLHLADDRADAHIQLALLARRAGNLPKSADEWRTAMRLEPYLSGPRSELAQLLIEASAVPAEVGEEVEKLRREEIELLKRDIGLVPDSAEARYHLGRMYILVGDLANSEAILAEAHKLAPRDIHMAITLARVQQERFKNGDEKAFDRAVETLKRMHEVNPNSPHAENILRDLMQLRQERDGAKAGE